MQLSQMHYTDFAYKEKHILQHNIPCSGLAGSKMNKYNKQINGYTTSWWKSTSFFRRGKLLHTS